MLGSKALLIVDGGAPKAVAPGETHKGVKVLSTQGDQAVVEIGGKRHTLRVGDAPATSAAAAAAAGNKIVLTAGSGGHFVTQGAINGRAGAVHGGHRRHRRRPEHGDAERIGIELQGRPADPHQHRQRQT
jgi:aspartyl protease family protein